MPISPSQLTIQHVFASNTTQSKFLIQPQTTPKHGNTRHFKSYTLDTPEVKKFADNLCSFNGRSKPAHLAKQIAVDIAKFIAFSDETKFSWLNITNESKIRGHVEKLEEAGVGPDGILTKLERLQLGMKYALMEIENVRKHKEEAELASSRIDMWKGTFKVKKLTHAHNVAAESVDKTDDDLEFLRKLLSNETAKRRVQSIIQKMTPNKDEFNFIATHLFAIFTYKNMHRAGAAINMTLTEAKSAKQMKDDEGNIFLKLLVKQHKTATTYGPATVYVDKEEIPIFNWYMEQRRKVDETTTFLVRHNGSTYTKHYTRYMRQFCDELGIKGEMPNITRTRKAGAKATSAQLTSGEMDNAMPIIELISAHLIFVHVCSYENFYSTKYSRITVLDCLTRILRETSDRDT